MVLGEGLGLAVAGCAIGLAGTLVAGRALSGFLYGVSAWDPLTMLGVMAIVAVVALTACIMPGRRAAGEDPAAVLHGD
jgi:ABC-type antimicrobial peptide transport system permease subunit